MARGRDARSPVKVPVAGWLDVGARLAARVGALNVGLLAAGVAFYGLLSLFPAITAGIALVGLVYDPATLVEESGWLLAMLPQSASTLIGDQLSAVAGAGDSSLGLAALFSLGLAVWSSSNATGSLVQGLNVVYEETDTRNFFKLRGLVILLTLGIIAGLSLMIAIVGAIPAAMSFMNAGSRLTEVALIIRWPLMFLVGMAGIAVLYRFGPDRAKARWRWITPGAVLACALWVGGTWGFSFYVQNFASYNETFGALAGVIVLLTWMWLSAFIVLFGAQLDAELESQTRHDSTVGPDEPMGRRGAYKADNLGETREETKAEKDGKREPEFASAR